MAAPLIIQGVRGYVDVVGTAQLNLEDVARGLGFIQSKNGNEYVRWETVYGYLSEIGFSQQVGKDGFIPENIFYRLAMKAKNEVAEVFQAKVADEILPAIRQHGGYLTPAKIEEVLLNPDTIIDLAKRLKQANEEKAKLAAKVETDKPKVIFADSVAVSKTSILVRDLAKILKQNGVDTGEKRLFEKLREEGYLIRRKGSDYNMPTQRSMEMGLFEIKATSITHSDGHVTISKTPKVTGKGQIYFINRYKSCVKEIAAL
ncbi:phage antirepressor KilAC domain-containing protein [Paenibacillus sp. y28]|uniref:phage antirepressor KilAC domain-containing protein n=1 Tax=Paenibacillus sp. y28 TaxID=3129110 RepID=UPI003016D4FC